MRSIASTTRLTARCPWFCTAPSGWRTTSLKLGRISTPVPAAYAYAESLDTDDKIAGAAYVLTGAHLMGGEIMRRRLEGYPTSHLVWDDRKAALEELKAYRVRSELAAEARDCFTALLRIMDEIKERTDGRA
jgi:hypothetical protein